MVRYSTKAVQHVLLAFPGNSNLTDDDDDDDDDVDASPTGNPA
jgi:hypothetical protein